MNTQIATVSSSYVLSAIEGGLKVTEIIVTEYPAVKEIITPGIVGVSRAVLAWSKKPSEYAKGQVVKVSNLEELKTWLVGKPEIKSLLVDPKRKVTGWSFLLIQRGKSVVRIPLIDGTAFVRALSQYLVANPVSGAEALMQPVERVEFSEEVLTPLDEYYLHGKTPNFDKMTVKEMRNWLVATEYKGKIGRTRDAVREACEDRWEEIESIL